jgi:hypothetical protein
MLAQILHGSVRALLTDGSAPSRASADIKRFLYQPALSSIANCRSAISRHWRRSSRGSDEPEVNFVRRGDPIPAGHARLTQSEYEKATDGTLVLEFGTEKGQPIGAKEYVHRVSLEWYAAEVQQNKLRRGEDPVKLQAAQFSPKLLEEFGPARH